MSIETLFYVPKEVMKLLHVKGRSTLPRWEKENPNFPKRVKFSTKLKGRSFYHKHEIDALVATRESGIVEQIDEENQKESVAESKSVG